ncbi:MAG TPA: electron transfer flavoprotein-ubiquinone oxidoreductase [Steroidobacteraceae bacterium]|nr:electron transfer flavoprotein-ubiquinone oxidoreductase [Steroidobacteraceae bacterium]
MDREIMRFDVLVVGAGPAGLSAAIRLRQLCRAQGRDYSVCVIEKGAEVGAHILSGAVLDPIALDELFPDWQARGAPLNTPVTEDRFLVLTEGRAIRIPQILLPPLMHNRGNYVVSLGNLCRWLAQQAEALGVEIYPGFAAAQVLYDDDGSVRGVVTGDMGVARDGHHKESFIPGVELHARYTLFAEGARGSLTKGLIERFSLSAGSNPQRFGLGVKELWEVATARHRPGLVLHTLGWPLDRRTGGGAFLYHLESNRVAVGFVVHLDYRNPHLSPFEELQRFKTHPAIRAVFQGGKRIAYGARAITEGGLQSIPKLSFPGGVLIGCAAGFVNLPRIKGSHNAMKTGMLAAEAAFGALAAGSAGGGELTAYRKAFRRSWVYRELHRVRNVKPGLEWGLWLGMLHGGLHMWLNDLRLGFLAPWTLDHHGADFQALRPIGRCSPVTYPKPDGRLTFDRLSSVFISNTNHEEDQPCHLVLRDPSRWLPVNFEQYGAPEQRYCPAGVYEVVRDADGSHPRLQINAQNCVHCKACDIKDPTQNIDWVPPEGGGGPNYTGM